MSIAPSRDQWRSRERSEPRDPGEEAPFFVDWVTCSQVHPEGGLPIVNAGVVWAADADGAIEWRVTKKAQHEGSFSTKLNIRSDGHRVEISGNLSRFGRPDNLFGFDLVGCIERANRVLALYGLPPFTAGERRTRKRAKAIGQGRHAGKRYDELGDRRRQVLDDHTRSADADFDGWTGARISRLDVTANYEAGSAEAAHVVMQYLGTQHNGRHKGKTYGDGETVVWGEGSRRQMWKVYVKAIEMARHAKKEGRELDPQVFGYVRDRGVVRLEGTIRSNALTDMGCAFLGDWLEGTAMAKVIELFKEHAAVMSRAERSTDDLDELPKHLRATARDYLAGMDCAALMTRRTFYRHRAQLLSYGIDLAIRNVAAFKPRVRVVELVRAEVPTWYQLAA